MQPFLFQHIYNPVNPCFRKNFNSFPVDRAKGVSAGNHHAGYLMLYNEIGTRRSFALMSTWLQVYIQCTLLQQPDGFFLAVPIYYIVYCVYFGMRLPVFLMPSFTYTSAFACYYRAYKRIRTYMPFA